MYLVASEALDILWKLVQSSVQNGPLWNGLILGLWYCSFLENHSSKQLHTTLRFLGSSAIHLKCEVDRMNGCGENRRKVRHAETPSIIVRCRY